LLDRIAALEAENEVVPLRFTMVNKYIIDNQEKEAS